MDETLDHQTLHFTWTLTAFVASLVLTVIIRNRLIRRRLLISSVVLLAAMGLHEAIVQGWLASDAWWKVEGVVLAFGVIQGVVVSLFNPWFEDRPSDRVPAIVQDAATVGLVVVAAVGIWQNAELLTGSAIAAAVLGFALQETLGNLFAGLAIQLDKPFRVGHWITVGDHEGTVRQITWRATKIWTKQGNMVILPNSVVASSPINNYSEPQTPTRLYVEVGLGYQVPPNRGRAALLRALSHAKCVLPAPAPQVLLWEFAGSSINFRVQFWVADYSTEETARDEVRSAIYYELNRQGIEIPWPIQIEYSREEPPIDTPERRERFRQTIAAVPVFAPLPADAHHALAASATESLFADGEVIVKEADPGSSLYIVSEGEVVITVGPNRQEVAVTKAGGYFGEMSLLTGDPRTATVTARGDTTVLEIGAEAFRAYIQSHPDAIDKLAEAAVERRRQLEESRGRTPPPAKAATVSLAERMRRFFGLAERSGAVMK